MLTSWCFEWLIEHVWRLPATTLPGGAPAAVLDCIREGHCYGVTKWNRDRFHSRERAGKFSQGSSAEVGMGGILHEVVILISSLVCGGYSPPRPPGAMHPRRSRRDAPAAVLDCIREGHCYSVTEWTPDRFHSRERAGSALMFLRWECGWVACCTGPGSSPFPDPRGEQMRVLNMPGSDHVFMAFSPVGVLLVLAIGTGAGVMVGIMGAAG